MQRSEAIEHVTEIVRRSGTSFYRAMRILPPHRRNAMFAIYAFCREVDDIADGPGDPTDKRARLESWRNEVEGLFNNAPGTPVTCALQGPVKEFGLDRENFLSVIEGMEIDAAPRLRMADMAALEVYCDHAACAVGRLSNRVFGIDDIRGEEVATALGHALQLTNILRDLAEDAALDRIYLPRDMLAAHGIGDGSADVDASTFLSHPALPAAAGELAGLVEQRFSQAETALAACDRRLMRPAIMMMQVYRALFRRLQHRGWNPLGVRISLPAWQKLWILCRYGLA